MREPDDLTVDDARPDAQEPSPPAAGDRLPYVLGGRLRGRPSRAGCATTSPMNTQTPTRIVGNGINAPIVSFRDAGGTVFFETPQNFCAHLGGTYDLPGWGSIRLASAGGREGGGLRLSGVPVR